MKLFVDQGNSRCKFWWLDAAGAIVRELALQDPQALSRLPAVAVMTVAVSSVAQPVQREALRLALLQHCPAAVVHWAAVDARRMPTRYQQPGRLGVDRWLAALACREPGVATLVVDAGTALTVDAVGATGEHLGGYILPGLALQRQALADHTAQVRFPESDWSGLEWGRDTAAAVGHGSLLAMVALISAAQQRLSAGEGVSAALVLTGGDAGVLQPWLPEAHHQPQLLLQGLMRYLAAGESDDGGLLAKD